MKPKIIPAIHYENDDQVLRNAKKVYDAGCKGVMIIHMEGKNILIPPVAKAVKEQWPSLLVGINLLEEDPERAVQISIENGLDMTWIDEQITHSSGGPWDYAQRVNQKASRDRNHLIFSGVSFKYQAHEPDAIFSAKLALGFGFIPTTSGPGTGMEANAEELCGLRAALGDRPLAIASGITPDNLWQFEKYVTHILVATGISSSFHEIDPDLLKKLMENNNSEQDTDDPAEDELNLSEEEPLEEHEVQQELESSYKPFPSWWVPKGNKL